LKIELGVPFDLFSGHHLILLLECLLVWSPVFIMVFTGDVGRVKSAFHLTYLHFIRTKKSLQFFLFGFWALDFTNEDWNCNEKTKEMSDFTVKSHNKDTAWPTDPEEGGRERFNRSGVTVVRNVLMFFSECLLNCWISDFNTSIDNRQILNYNSDNGEHFINQLLTD